MKRATLADLQESLRDKAGFRQLADYQKFCLAYLALLAKQSDGQWRITHLIWDDPPNQRLE